MDLTPYCPFKVLRFLTKLWGKNISVPNYARSYNDLKTDCKCEFSLFFLKKVIFDVVQT